jgi:hypothetical protein
MKRIALCLVALFLSLPVLGEPTPPKMTPEEEAKVQAFWDQFLPIERALFSRITDAEFDSFIKEIDAPMKEWKQDKKEPGLSFIVKWRAFFQGMAKDYLDNKDSARGKPRKAEGAPWERFSEFEHAMIQQHLFRLDYKTRADEKKPAEQEIKDFCKAAVYPDRLCAQYEAMLEAANKKYFGPPQDLKAAEAFLANWRGFLRAELSEYLKVGAPKDMDQKKLIADSVKRAQAAIKGMTPIETAEDKAAKEKREALAGKAQVLADKMAAALNQRRAAGELPDAQGTITVTPTATDKGETVFTATDGQGTKVQVKKLSTAEIEKMEGAAAEELGTKAAKEILNGNFRAARMEALKESVSDGYMPGADGKVPLPVLGPGGAMGGEPGCGAAGGDSLADYKKRLERDAKEKSAKSSAARQKLEKEYDEKYQKIVAEHRKAVAAANANPLLSPAQRAAAIQAADEQQKKALGEIDKAFKPAAEGVSKQTAADESVKWEASFRADRFLRSQAAQRVETIRDAWEKDVSQAKKSASGDLAKFLSPALVKEYFDEEWSAGGAKYESNLTECAGQVRFGNPASVDQFVGKHLSRWCEDRKAKHAVQGGSSAGKDDLSAAARQRREELLREKKP